MRWNNLNTYLNILIIKMLCAILSILVYWIVQFQVRKEPQSYYTILYYTILYYTILYYTILYYTILYTIYYILYTMIFISVSAQQLWAGQIML